MFKKKKKDELVELVQEVIDNTPLEHSDADFEVGKAYRATWKSNLVGATRKDRVYVMVGRNNKITKPISPDEAAKVIAKWSVKVAKRVQEKGVSYFFDNGVNASFHVRDDVRNSRIRMTEEWYLVEFNTAG